MKKSAIRAVAAASGALLAVGLAGPALAHPKPWGPNPGSQASQAVDGQRGSGNHGSNGQGIGKGRLSGLGLTRDQIDLVHGALVTSRTTASEKMRASVLAGLVTAKTITESQAAAIAAARGRGALRALVDAGTLTLPQLQAVQDAMEGAGRPDFKAAASEALTALVTPNTATGRTVTITAEQVTLILNRIFSGANSGSMGQSGQSTPGALSSDSSTDDVQGVAGVAPGRGHGHGHGELVGGSQADDDQGDDDQGEDEQGEDEQDD